MTLTLSTVRENCWYRSSGLYWSSSRARSTLLMMTTGLIRSVRACRRTVSVWTQTPSIQSTTTKAPSVTRRAAVTSEEKSTCPGESIKLIKNSSPKLISGYEGKGEDKKLPSVFCLIAAISSSLTRKYMEIAVDLIVIPRAFSSSLVSVNRVSPALDEAIIPAFETRESVKVDFPWSTRQIGCDGVNRDQDHEWD